MTAVALTLAVAFLAALGWGMYWRWQAEAPQDEVWAARFEREVWKAKATSLEAENAHLHAIQTEHDLLAGDTIHVPLVIPGQRTGEHDDLPVADGVFPVHTEVDDTWLELLVTRPVDGPAS